MGYTPEDALGYDPATTIDLGDGHYLEPTTCYAHPDDGITGYVEIHPRPDNGEACTGIVALKGHGHGTRGDGSPRPEWDLVSEEPLTLSPSILCRICGTHGWVRNGIWVGT